MRKIICLAAMILLFHTQSAALGKFRYYTMEQGLSSNIVYTLCQDSMGIVWAGTELGLCWGNGREFTPCEVENNEKLIKSILVIRDVPWMEDIWVGTTEGLYTANKSRKTIAKIKSADKEAPSEGCPVTRLAVDADKNIWIGTYGHGVFRYNTVTGKWKHYIGSTEEAIISDILVTNDYETWMADGKNLFKYNTTTDSFDKIKIEDWFSGTEMNDAWLICQDTYGNLWICDTSCNLWRLDRKDLRCIRYELDTKGESITPRAMIEYQPGIIAIGTNSGLIFHDSTRRKYSWIDRGGWNTCGKLSDRFIHSMLKDKDGGLWIGTYYGGINYCSEKTNLIETIYPAENCGHIISAMSEMSDGKVLIGSDDGGLSVYDPFDGSYSRWDIDPHCSNLNVRSVLVENDFIWVGTFRNGLYRYDTRTGHIKIYVDDNVPGSKDVYLVYRDKSGRLWAGTKRGVSLYDEKTDSFNRMVILRNSSNVCGIIQDGQTFYFASDDDGLLVYDSENGDCSRVPGDYPDNVRSITMFNDTLYAGTAQGVYRMYEGRLNRCEGYYMKSCQVFGMVTEYSGIWITTDKGLIQYDAAGKETQFTDEDGLLEGNFSNNSIAKLSSGKILIGGARGINSFVPSALKNSNVPVDVRVVITGIEGILPNSDPVKYNHNERIKISSNRACLKVNFIAINYESQKKNIYKYRLKGYDDNWREATDEDVKQGVLLTDVKPGRYTFEVAAAAARGMEFNKVSRKELQIIKPLANRMHVLLCNSIILLFLGITAFMKIRNKHLKRITEAYRKETVRFAFNKLILDSTVTGIKSIIQSQYLSGESLSDIDKLTDGITSRIRIYDKLSDEQNQDSGLIRVSECIQKVCEICDGISSDQLEFSVKYSYSGISNAMVKASPFMRALLGMIEEMIERKGKEINMEAEATNETATVCVWSEASGQRIKKEVSFPVINSESTKELKVRRGEFSDESPNIVIIDSSIRYSEKECMTDHDVKYNFVRCMDIGDLCNVIDGYKIIAVVVNMDYVSDADRSALKDLKAKHSEIVWIHTGDRHKERDIIEDLDEGAELFLTQPFSLDLIAAQVKAISRFRDKEWNDTPEQSPSSAKTLCKKSKFSGEVYNLILRHLSDPNLSIDSLSREMGVSRATIFNKIRSQTGLTPNVLIRKIRLEKAAELLCKPNVRVSEIYDQTGFMSGSYFSKLFKEEFGMTPKEFCDKGKDN